MKYTAEILKTFTNCRLFTQNSYINYDDCQKHRYYNTSGIQHSLHTNQYEQMTDANQVNNVRSQISQAVNRDTSSKKPLQ